MHHPSKWMARVGLFSALAAAGVAAVLAYAVLVDGAGVPGCGGGDGWIGGCGEVLGSRWGKVFGVPVSLPALMVDALVALGWVRVLRGVAGRWTRRGLAFGAGLLLGAAVWFMGLMAVELGAWCMWCLTGHALGTLSGLLAVLWLVRVSHRQQRAAEGDANEPVDASEGLARPSARGAKSIDMLPLGLVGVIALALAQALGPAGRDVGGLAQGPIVLLNGALELDWAKESVFGEQDRERLLVVFGDYLCGFCQTAHGTVRESVSAREDTSVWFLPVSLTSGCHAPPVVGGETFAESCGITEAALTVLAEDPGAFEVLDRAIREAVEASKDGGEPVTAERARAMAREVLGEARFDAASQAGRGAALLERNHNALRSVLASTPRKSLPVLWVLPDGFVVVGALTPSVMTQVFTMQQRTEAP